MSEAVISYFPGIIAAIGGGAAAIIGALNRRDVKSVKKTSEATHILSNSAMGAQLAINVELLQALSVQAHRFASLTKQDGDVATAKAFDVRVEGAKKLYQEHLTKQAVVDAQVKGESA
jgi:hypothetical protein